MYLISCHSLRCLLSNTYLFDCFLIIFLLFFLSLNYFLTFLSFICVYCLSLIHLRVFLSTCITNVLFIDTIKNWYYYVALLLLLRLLVHIHSRCVLSLIRLYFLCFAVHNSSFHLHYSPSLYSVMSHTLIIRCFIQWSVTFSFSLALFHYFIISHFYCFVPFFVSFSFVLFQSLFVLTLLRPTSSIPYVSFLCF